jgi:iron complex transport system ATP-binding protein
MQIAFKQLVVGYKQGILQPADVLLEGAGLSCLLGLNGMGKTTLLRTITGLQQPISGAVTINTSNVHLLQNAERARLVSVILTGKPFIYNMSVIEVLALGRYPHIGLLAQLGDKDKEVISAVLQQLQIQHLENKKVDELSDGELQLIMMARALCQQTPLIVMDEPTAFLDIKNRKLLFQLLAEVSIKEQKRVVLSTHELDMALRYAHDLLVIDEKRNLIHFTNSPMSKEIVEKALGI